MLSNEFVISGKGKVLFDNYSFDLLDFDVTYFSGDIKNYCYTDICYLDYGTAKALIKQVELERTPAWKTKKINYVISFTKKCFL